MNAHNADNDAWQTCECVAPSGHPWRGVPHDCAAVRRGEGDQEPPAVVWETYSFTPGFREPPEGWFTFGTHVDQAVRLEFSEETDDALMPLWERPIPPASGQEQSDA